jgi:hypothetical protein
MPIPHPRSLVGFIASEVNSGKEHGTEFNP